MPSLAIDLYWNQAVCSKILLNLNLRKELSPRRRGGKFMKWTSPYGMFQYHRGHEHIEKLQDFQGGVEGEEEQGLRIPEVSSKQRDLAGNLQR